MDQMKLLQQRWADMPQPRKIKALRVVVFVCYSLALLFFVIYAFGGTTKRVSEPMPVVLFMESMPGGIMALRYLAKRADVFIAMIVLATDAWNVNLNAAYDNTAAFIAMMRKEGVLLYDIPIYYGNSVAQANARFDEDVSFTSINVSHNTTSCTYRRVLDPNVLLDADRLFGASDLLDGVPISAPRNNSDGSTLSGQMEFFDVPLLHYLTRHTASFLVLGPSTDAAWFLQQHPDQRSRVSLVIMAGGVMGADGDTRLVYPPNRRSELHMFFDPHAANYLVSGAHGRQVLLLLLDAAPKWPAPLYESLIVARASSSAATSANVVAHAVSGFNRRFAAELPLPVEVATAAYFADLHIRGGVTVTEVPLLVANGVAMATDGMLGTPADVHKQPTGLKVKAVLKLQEGTFWSRFERVDRLTL
ncbi:pyrimidine-specific ribonucleoside hydrolase [Trypanosoma grayi]|uniref:pyrimidine-specific ribonucleoside hydrolase n=1 Tax=Trypanosoma grayi TaxID=71804 RepID=UPI0004F4A004|nr:pyrimidine-specific ribonucleoside hydrolase [Trypanosoma grayi]KEG12271.1 pyrimidine-specific ribonucleoside hydrolase [Trypanosoma grayi]